MALEQVQTLLDECAARDVEITRLEAEVQRLGLENIDLRTRLRMGSCDREHVLGPSVRNDSIQRQR